MVVMSSILFARSRASNNEGGLDAADRIIEVDDDDASSSSSSSKETTKTRGWHANSTHHHANTITNAPTLITPHLTAKKAAFFGVFDDDVMSY